MEKINQALLEIQTELKVPKGQFNKHGNFKYRSLEDICKALKPVLQKKQLVFLLSDDIVYIGDRFYIKATATLSLLDGSEKIETKGFAREPDQQKGMAASMLTGSASSYARKYACNSMFLTDDSKDIDSINTKDDKGSDEPSPEEIKLEENDNVLREHLAGLPDYETAVDWMRDNQQAFIKMLGGAKSERFKRFRQHCDSTLKSLKD